MFVFAQLFSVYNGVRMGGSPRLPRIRRCGASCHLRGFLEVVIFLSASFLLFLYPCWVLHSFPLVPLLLVARASSHPDPVGDGADPRVALVGTRPEM